MEEKHIQELIETTARSKSNSHRIDELEKDVKENNQLAINVRELTLEIKHMREDYQRSDAIHAEAIANVSSRLAEVENKPAKRYEQILGYILARYSISCTGLFYSQMGGVV